MHNALADEMRFCNSSSFSDNFSLRLPYVVTLFLHFYVYEEQTNSYWIESMFLMIAKRERAWTALWSPDNLPWASCSNIVSAGLQG